MNLGYANLNYALKKQGIYTNRAIKKKTLEAKGLGFLSELWLKNATDLKTLLQWNVDNDIKLFRLSADVLPWASKVKYENIPDMEAIKDMLAQAGEVATKSGMRITMHPGQFNILSSPIDSVVQNSFEDLRVHSELLDFMNQSRSYFNKVNIHIGATYGDKESALERWISNYNKLPEAIKSRLTIENDDKASMYSVLDLMEVHKQTNIPIVFDYHHHKFCTGGLSEQEALELAISTWPKDIVPIIHYSESKALHENNPKLRPQAHSDFINELPNTYGHTVDCMIESKGKEVALLEIRKKYL